MANPTQLAEQFAKELAQWPSGRLPSVRELAQTKGASTKTVQAALAILRTKGVIESRPRSGLWRVGELPHPPVLRSRSGAPELEARLRSEIAAGVHPWESPFPLLKELAVQWNCHVQTASKVLDAVVAAGLLERRGRFHYPRIQQRTRKGRSPTILCLGAGAEDGRFRMDTDRESDFYRELGAQAALAGLSLVRRVWTSGQVKIEPGCIGVVATAWHFSDPLSVSRALEHLRIPACIWVDDHILGNRKSSSRIRYHDQGFSSAVGGMIARHLLENGHAHLAFLSPWHRSRWAQKRFDSIEKEVQKEGGKVVLCALQGESEWDRLVPAQKDPLLTEQFPYDTLTRILEGPADGIRERVVAELGWNRVRQDMVPLLEQALASGATAWVGANDICALNALHWLQAQEIPVPEQISVAGFDDTVEALRADLTSYRFSCATVARSMIHQILTDTGAGSLTLHEGTVVVRGTTGIRGKPSSLPKQ